MAFTINSVSKTRAQVDTFVVNAKENTRAISASLKRLDVVQNEYDTLDAARYSSTEYTALRSALSTEITNATAVVSRAVEALLTLAVPS